MASAEDKLVRLEEMMNTLRLTAARQRHGDRPSDSKTGDVQRSN